jgi:hypothetical protein
MTAENVLQIVGGMLVLFLIWQVLFGESSEDEDQ